MIKNNASPVHIFNNFCIFNLSDFSCSNSPRNYYVRVRNYPKQWLNNSNKMTDVKALDRCRRRYASFAERETLQRLDRLGRAPGAFVNRCSRLGQGERRGELFWQHEPSRRRMALPREPCGDHQCLGSLREVAQLAKWDAHTRLSIRAITNASGDERCVLPCWAGTFQIQLLSKASGL